ncbi:beta-fructofuranosidase [Aequitasia blattaphilus]|uniref:beta-fructofuranosidase n=1 Tax=Aequitasia blattaphilus TaxID=2949332 RepID=A0ABT1E939_9FIRM|nr:family 43 glycosylhydrolase [Aequitasia blattaphilus]MCP1102345.1 family 43 glycosylhydrolase [Aequitasia blattaphilus]MCR8614985.1 family 43 glycosylhydrolase [Aequitasia blattaphilus]
MKLFYQFPETWFGDCMPFGHGDEFFLYHQRDTRKPGPFGEPFGWDLATTSDFVNYKDCGVAVPRGTDEEQDQFIFAGSVFEAEGKFHIFYTGYNRDFPKQGKASQVLMHATSDDLYNWVKTDDKLTFVPQEGYDPDDWRDPFVVWDDERQEYLLILGGRKRGPKTKQSGRTVKFTSKDLQNWEFKGDFWAPGLYTMHEMPDLFKIGDWWYHIVTEYSDRSKMIYRMSKSLDGPWIAPKDDAFDGRAYYAGRSFELKGQRVLFGWVPTKEDDDDKNNFEWGGTFVPHEIYQREDGSLGVKIPDTIVEAFEEKRSIDDTVIEAPADGRESQAFAKDLGDVYYFEADVTFSKGTRSFGIRMMENPETEQSYQYIFQVMENRFVFEKNPNWPWPSCMNIGLERPIDLETEKTYHIQLIVDDTISVLYVDGVAMCSRMYEELGNQLSLFVTDGKMEVKNIKVSNTLKQ